MKTAAKVFLIIGMVIKFWLIIPLVIGILAFKKLNVAKTKEELGIAYPILVILFVDIIAGILMLLMKDQDFAK